MEEELDVEVDVFVAVILNDTVVAVTIASKEATA